MNARLTPALLLLAGGLSAQEPAREPAPAPTTVPAAAPMRWTDPDGKPLPFASEADLLEFLRTASVTSSHHVSGGVTQPSKLTLDQAGVRANAIFRDVNEEKTAGGLGGGVSDLFFRDSYIFEPAAYELSRLLGLDNVPPATLRIVYGKRGSIQIWVEHAMTEGKRLQENLHAPDTVQWNKQIQMMNVFDALIYNTDRNRGNLLITPDWKLWMIDHTRAFRRISALQNAGSINQCERRMYERLKTLNEAFVRDRLKDYLRSLELDALFARRKLIVERLDKLIAERGEAQVLYDFVFEPVAEPPATPAAPAN